MSHSYERLTVKCLERGTPRLWLINVIITTLRVPLRPPHDPAFYTFTLLCCSSPYTSFSGWNFPTLRHPTTTLPPGRSIPGSLPYTNSHPAFVIQSIFYLFPDYTICPLPFYPPLVSSFPDFICYDHIRRVLCTLLCVCPSILDLVECYRLLAP